MIAKVIVHAATPRPAIDRLIGALEASEIQGPKNNIPGVLAVLRSEPFAPGVCIPALSLKWLAQKIVA